MIHSIRQRILLLSLFALGASHAGVTAQVRTVGLLAQTPEAVSPGYTLFAPKHNTMTYLIDTSGRVVNRWDASIYEPGQAVYLRENGNLLRMAFTRNRVFGGGGDGGRIEEYDWDDRLVWEFDWNSSVAGDEHMIHHDIAEMPNGNILAISWEYRSREEALANGRRQDMLPDGQLWPDYVIEIEKTPPIGGRIVWEWHVWDHLIQDYDPSKANYGIVGAYPGRIDINYWAETGRPAHANWNHTNSITYNAELDQIMLSVRGFSEVWVIDHSTTSAEAATEQGGRSGRGGALLYRWGNPAAYRAGSGADQALFQQHDPTWIEPGYPGDGHVLVFNNGPELGYSRVTEFDIPTPDAQGRYPIDVGSAFGPTGVAWEYRPVDQSLFFSGEISGAQRLPNGNTLICSGTKGYFTEITAAKELVWAYRNPMMDHDVAVQGQQPGNDDRGHGLNAVFKIHRYAPDFPGFAGRTLVPGNPIEAVTTGTEPGEEPSESAWGLAEIHPNPFSTGVSIEIAPGDGRGAEVAIHDLLGRRIRTLTTGQFAAAVNWDGLDGDGRAVPAGVYMVVLRSGTRVASRPVVRIR